MKNTVVVTLRSKGYEKDFELPSNIKLEELYPRLTSALQSANPKVFGDYESIILELDDSALLDTNATLNDFGVCTGKILTVVGQNKSDRLRGRRW